jgi:hypothetical protein
LMQLPIGVSDFRCAAVFRENHARWRWDASFELTEAELEAEISKRRDDGLVPLSIGSYTVSSPNDSTEVRYVALWVESAE